MKPKLITYRMILDFFKHIIFFTWNRILNFHSSQSPGFVSNWSSIPSHFRPSLAEYHTCSLLVKRTVRIKDTSTCSIDEDSLKKGRSQTLNFLFCFQVLPSVSHGGIWPSHIEFSRFRLQNWRWKKNHRRISFKHQNRVQLYPSGNRSLSGRNVLLAGVPATTLESKDYLHSSSTFCKR